MVEETNKPNLIRQIGDELGRIFRHMIPGLSILSAARWAHPLWFQWVDYGNSLHLVVLAAVAVVAGNTLYVFHRYSLHQLIDLLLYRICVAKNDRQGYLPWLIAHIDKCHHVDEADRRLQEHIALRSAQVIFMFLTCEIAFAFSVRAQPGSFFERYHCLIRVTAVLSLAPSFIQQWIGFKLDMDFADRLGKRSPSEISKGAAAP